MTSWKCKAQLLLLVLLNTINRSHGGCAEYFNNEKWRENIFQPVALVKTEDPQDIAECTWEKEYSANNPRAVHILRDCFNRKKQSDMTREKCKRQTSGEMPYDQFMCLTIAAINRTYPGEKIFEKEFQQCKYDTTCRLLSGQPLTATPTTLPERTVVTPTATTTELPPTTTNSTQNTGLNQSTTLPLTQPKGTTTAVPPKVTQPSSSPPTTATTKSELPPTNSSQNAEKRYLDNEKEATENLALKIFSVISATLNVAALMVFLYQRKSNPGLSQESVATFVSDGESSEAQLMAELKLCTKSAPADGHGVETTCLIKLPEPASNSTHSPLTPNGCPVGNEE